MMSQDIGIFKVSEKGNGTVETTAAKYVTLCLCYLKDALIEAYVKDAEY
jgi:hypothetical protein